MIPTLQRAIDAHLRELNQDGLTVLPPYLVKALGHSADLPERLQGVLTRLMREGKAVERSVRNSVPVVEVHSLLGADPIFDDAVTHPAVVEVAESRLGEGFRLRSCAPLVVPAGHQPGQLHCDGGAGIVSCVWILTEYSRKSGSLCYVPGSQRLARMPKQGEGTDETIAVEASPGSLLAFDGSLWHGTWPRLIPGERLGVHCPFMRASRRH